MCSWMLRSDIEEHEIAVVGRSFQAVIFGFECEFGIFGISHQIRQNKWILFGGACVMIFP